MVWAITLKQGYTKCNSKNNNGEFPFYPKKKTKYRNGEFPYHPKKKKKNGKFIGIRIQKISNIFCGLLVCCI